jgi:predicted nuclease of restriction endonuclease-like (RecB) superfamily
MITDGIQNFNQGGTKMKLDKSVLKTINTVKQMRERGIYIPRKIRRDHVKSVLKAEIAKSQRQKTSPKKEETKQLEEKADDKETQNEIVSDKVIQD